MFCQIFIHKIKKGETVGYDRSFKAEKDMVVGVLPIGYADGLDRRLSNNFFVLINGEFVPIIGNICILIKCVFLFFAKNMELLRSLLQIVGLKILF